MLTSNGLSSPRLRMKFAGLLEGKINEKQVLVIHTAQKTEHLQYVSEVGNELAKAGILHPNITYLNISSHADGALFSKYDILYVCGGNTYFILDRLRKTGLVNKIKYHVKSGKVYVGVSAGSIIPGPDISIAGWGSEGDPNDISLRNLEGLHFTNISIFPHYKAKLKKEVQEFEGTVKYPVMTLS